MADDRSIKIPVELDDKQAQKELNRLETSIRKAQDSIARKNIKKDGITAQLEEATRKADALQAKLSELKTARASVSERRNSISNELTEAATAADAAKAKIASLKAELAPFEAQEAEAHNKMISSLERLREARASGKWYSPQIKENAQRAAEAYRQAAEANSAAQARIVPQIEEQGRAYERATNNARALKTELAGLKSEESYAEPIKETEAALKEATTEVKRRQTEEARVNQQILDEEGNLRRLNNEYSQVNLQLQKQGAQTWPQVKAQADAAISGMSINLKKGLKTILKYGFGIRSMYILFRKIRTALIAGLKEFAEQDAQTKASLDGMKSSLNGLKGALASAFAPIVNAVAPYIIKLIDWLTDAINAIARFFAILSGKSTYKKAVKGLGSVGSAVSDAGGAVDDLQDKITNLSGLDELNIWQDADKSGGGGGGGGGSSGGGSELTWVEESVGELPKWLEDIKAFWEKVKQTLTPIPEWLKQKWQGLKDWVAEHFGSWELGVQTVVNFALSFLPEDIKQEALDWAGEHLSDLVLAAKASVAFALSFASQSQPVATLAQAWLAKEFAKSDIVADAMASVSVKIGDVIYSAKEIADAVRAKVQSVTVDAVNILVDLMVKIGHVLGIDASSVGDRIKSQIGKVEVEIPVNLKTQTTVDTAGQTTGNSSIDILHQQHGSGVVQDTTVTADNAEVDLSGADVLAEYDGLEPGRTLGYFAGLVLSGLLGAGSLAAGGATAGAAALTIPATAMFEEYDIGENLKKKHPELESNADMTSWSPNFGQNTPWANASAYFNSFDSGTNGIAGRNGLGTPWAYTSAYFNWWDKGKSGFAYTNGLGKPWSYTDAYFNWWDKGKNGFAYTNGLGKPWAYTDAYFNWWDKGKNGFSYTNGLGKPWAYTDAYFNWWDSGSYGIAGRNRFGTPWAYTDAYFNWYDGSGSGIQNKNGFGTPWAYGNAYFDYYDQNYDGSIQNRNGLGKPWAYATIYADAIYSNDGSKKYAAGGGAFYGGKWHDIPQYASGTRNAHGSLFIAGEAGPEVVGHIGGRTEVLNQSQLAATMAAAMSRAISNVRFVISTGYESIVPIIEAARAGIDQMRTSVEHIAYVLSSPNLALAGPAVATGTVIPPMLINISEDLEGIREAVDRLTARIDNLSTDRGDINLSARVRERVLFDMTIEQGKAIKQQTGKNPFDI